MPELPEVENIKRGLRGKVKGKRIRSIKVLLPKMVRRHATEKEVVLRARGKKVVEVKRK